MVSFKKLLCDFFHKLFNYAPKMCQNSLGLEDLYGGRKKKHFTKKKNRFNI